MSKMDLTGQKFGRLTVIKRDAKENHKDSAAYWICQCDCGNFTVARTSCLRRGEKISCGCYRKERIIETNTKDLTGQRFGNLTVLQKDESMVEKASHAYWICQCDCGRIKSIDRSHLINQTTRSCGCGIYSCKKSIGEKLIEEALIELDIPFRREYSFSDLIGKTEPLRFDFAIFTNKDKDKLKCLIEFQGKQHYEPIEYFGGDSYFELTQIRDLKKQNYCKEKHIPLIIISYKEQNKINAEYINKILL